MDFSIGMVPESRLIMPEAEVEVITLLPQQPEPEALAAAVMDQTVLQEATGLLIPAAEAAAEAEAPL